jgi:pimeloyl-ACP methyl ester carboxylesterase
VGILKEADLFLRLRLPNSLQTSTGIRIPPILSLFIFFQILRTGTRIARAILAADFVTVLPVASRIAWPVLHISGERDWTAPTERAQNYRRVAEGQKSAVHDCPGYTARPFSKAPAVQSFLDFKLAR